MTDWDKHKEKRGQKFILCFDKNRIMKSKLYVKILKNYLIRREIYLLEKTENI